MHAVTPHGEHSHPTPGSTAADDPFGSHPVQTVQVRSCMSFGTHSPSAMIRRPISPRSMSSGSLTRHPACADAAT